MNDDWKQKVTLLTRIDDNHPLTAQDALSAALSPDGKYLITSPNMDYIPTPVWGRLEVTMRADGKFGIEDPILWPQIHIPSSRWDSLSCIPRICHPRRRPDLWHRPTTSVLTPASSGVHGLFTLAQHVCQPLRTYVDELNGDIESFESSKGPNPHLQWLRLTMNTALNCLRVPSTERDVVRQLADLERCCCLVLGWLTWSGLFWNLKPSTTVHTDLMGCFTTCVRTAETLFRAGIPVWYMRLMRSITSDIRVVSCTQLRPPEYIVTETGDFGSYVVFRGSPGRRHVEAIIYNGGKYLDIEETPYPADYGDQFALRNVGQTSAALLGLPAASPSQAGPSRTSSSSNRKAEGRNKTRKKITSNNRPALPRSDPSMAQKFIEKAHPCIPLLLDGWESALRDGAHHLRPSVNSWALWAPEPYMLVGPPSVQRRERYVHNWLIIREAWWCLLRSPNSRKSMMARWWRAYLNDGFNHCAKVQPDHETARQYAVEVLDRAFGNQAFDLADLKPTWFGKVVTNVDDALCRQICWELSEMGFRLELSLLDRTLFGDIKLSPEEAAERTYWLRQVFPGGGVLEIAGYPTSDTGLASPILNERKKSLEALRRLMLAWPDCPELLKTSASLEQASESVLATLEPIIKQFYVRTFVKVANRPPALPRRLAPPLPLMTSLSPPRASSSPPPSFSPAYQASPPPLIAPLPPPRASLSPSPPSSPMHQTPPLSPHTPSASQAMLLEDYSPPAATPRYCSYSPSPPPF